MRERGKVAGGVREISDLLPNCDDGSQGKCPALGCKIVAGCHVKRIPAVRREINGLGRSNAKERPDWPLHRFYLCHGREGG